MVAMIFMTKYARNVDNKEDLICMQYQFQRGLNMLAIVLESRDYDFWKNLSNTNFR